MFLLYIRVVAAPVAPPKRKPAIEPKQPVKPTPIPRRRETPALTPVPSRLPKSSPAPVRPPAVCPWRPQNGLEI